MKPLLERFESKYMPEPNSGCWLWLSSISSSGYGEFLPGPTYRDDGSRTSTVRAHRWAYEYFRGPIPDGLQLDHLCRTRSCVNPDHLEPVTAAENTRRGETGINHRSKTHCPRGHELAGDNVYEADGRRHCRTCRAERAASLQQAKTHCKYGHPWPEPEPGKRRSCPTCYARRAKEQAHG